MSGRISLLVDSPLRDMYIAMRAVPADVQKNIMAQQRSEAEPIWTEELNGNAGTRLQSRVLVASATVGVTGRNTFLRSGIAGRLSSGTPVQVLAAPAEWGANASTPIRTRSRNGKPYTRRMGGAFGAPRRQGNVVRPAAAASLTRITSLIIQTAARTLLDAFDGRR